MRPMQDGVAHTLDRFADDDRLVIKRHNLDAGRQGLPDALDLGVNFVRNLHCVAVGLPVDVQQNRRLAVGGDDRVDGLHAAELQSPCRQREPELPLAWS